MDPEANTNNVGYHEGAPHPDFDAGAPMPDPAYIQVEEVPPDVPQEHGFVPEPQYAEPPPSEFAPMYDSTTPMPQPPTDGEAPLDCVIMPEDRPLPPSLPYCSDSPSPNGPPAPNMEVPWDVPHPTAVSAPLSGQAFDQHQMYGHSSVPAHAYDHHHMHGPSSMPLSAYDQHQRYGPTAMPHQAYGQQQMYGPSAMQPRSYQHQQMHGPSSMPPHAYGQVPMAGAVPMHPQTHPHMGMQPYQQQQQPPQKTHHDPDMDCEPTDHGDAAKAKQGRSRPRIKKPSSYVPTVLMLGLGIGWVVVLLSKKDSNLRVVLPVILVLLYLAIYTPEWIRSSTRKFLGNQQQESNLFHYVEALRQKKPSLQFHVSCWHEEKRHRQETRTDADGNTYTETKTDTVRKVTHTRTEPYAFTKWVDGSAALPVLDGCDLTKLYLTKSYGFLDEAGTNKYKRALEDFKRRTPPDKHMDFSTILAVDGFQEHTLCHLGDGSPGWVTSGCFMLASLFCCSLPYRMALDRKVVAHDHDIRKLIGE